MAQVLILIIIFIMVLVLSKKIVASQMIKAFQFIIRDLRSRGALAPETAVDLQYAKRSLIRFGLRDYRPKILIQLVQNQMVGVTEEGKYFLNESKLPPQDQISS